RKARFSATKEPVPPNTGGSSFTGYPLSSSSSKDGKSKLAIRLFDGSQVIQEFDAKEVLSAVRAFIVTQKNIDFNITFAMPLRPPFSEEDMEKSLLALGL